MNNIFSFSIFICSLLSCFIQSSSSFLFADQASAWQAISQTASKGVVRIKTQRGACNWLRPDKMIGMPIVTEVVGSGFFIKTEQGIFILTNHHVIEGAVHISIHHPFYMKQVQAHVEKIIPVLDVALLSIKQEETQRFFDSGCTFLELADSDFVSPGEEVAVVGYPLGLEYSKITQGIISGFEDAPYASSLGFSFPKTRIVHQISSAVNPGNSGGPCLNKEGKVIGIVSAKIEKTPDGRPTEGLGFSLPINCVKDLCRSDIKEKIFKASHFGCEVLPMTEEALNFLGCKRTGVRVGGVRHQSITQLMGVKQGDIVCAINQIPLDEEGYIVRECKKNKENIESSKYKMHLFQYFHTLTHGDTFTLTVFRDGEIFDLTGVVDKHSFSGPFEYIDPFLEADKIAYEVIGGMIITEPTACFAFLHQQILWWARKAYNPDSCTRPLRLLFISNVLNPSPAFQAKIPPFVLITKVNGISVATLDELRHAIKEKAHAGYISLETDQGGFYTLSLENIQRSEASVCQCHGTTTTPFMKEILDGVQL